MYKLKINELKKEYFQSENKEKLVVYFSLLTIDEKEEDEEKKVKHTDLRSLAFELETKEEDIKVELEKYLKSYKLEKDAALKNAANDEAHANADKAIANLKDLEL